MHLVYTQRQIDDLFRAKKPFLKTRTMPNIIATMMLCKIPNNQPNRNKFKKTLKKNNFSKRGNRGVIAYNPAYDKKVSNGYRQAGLVGNMIRWNYNG